MCINKSEFLTARGNTPIFIHNQCPGERQPSRIVKEVCGVSDIVNLASGQRNEPYKLTMRK